MLKYVLYKSISIRNIKDPILRILIKPVGLKYYGIFKAYSLSPSGNLFIYLNVCEEMWA